MKTKYIIALAAGALALVGCQREELADGFGPGDGQIRYSVTTVGLKSTAAETRIDGSLSLVSKDGKLTVPVNCEVSDGINLPENTSVTKGTLINTSGSLQKLPSDNKFTVCAYKNGSTTALFSGVASKSGDYWLMDPAQYWPLSTKLTFYAYANAGTNSVVPTATSQTLTYTVTPDAASHQDLMLGFYTGNGGNKGIAEIRFDHPLTAVRFKKGEMTGVTGIKSITISGLASGGTVTMDKDGAIGDWTVSDTEYKTVVTLSPSGEATTLGVDESTKLIGTDATGNYNGAFLLVPQNLASHKATVTVVLVTASGDVTVSADITSGKWEVGKTNTYTLGYTGGDEPDLLPGKFSVSETEYVQFSRGNLFCTDNGTTASPRYTFNFERNQYDFRNHPGKASLLNGVYSTSSGTPANTSGAFQWSVSAAVPGQDYGAFGTEYPGTPADDATIDWGQAIGGNWYTMEKKEMSYMVGYGSPEQKRPNYENLRKISKIVFSDFSVNGYVFAPDNYDFTSHPLKSSYTESEWTQAEKEYGLVFFSCAGYGNNAAAAGLVGRYYLSKNPGDHLYFGIDDADYIGTSAGEYYCTSVRLVQKFEKPHAYVDLGLSVQWATCNVGAENPYEYGCYYQWAGTQDVTSLSISWDVCPYHSGSNEYENWIKYIPSDASTYWSGGGSPDNKTVLDPADDVARMKCGSAWRIPSKDEFLELIENTEQTWVENYQNTGVNGFIFTSTKSGYTDKYIFLPAGGRINKDGLGHKGNRIYYWTSSLGTTYSTPGSGFGGPYQACGLFSTEDKSVSFDGFGPRFNGRNVRPVLE